MCTLASLQHFLAGLHGGDFPQPDGTGTPCAVRLLEFTECTSPSSPQSISLVWIKLKQPLAKPRESWTRTTPFPSPQGTTSQTGALGRATGTCVSEPMSLQFQHMTCIDLFPNSDKRASLGHSSCFGISDISFHEYAVYFGHLESAACQHSMRSSP